MDETGRPCASLPSAGPPDVDRLLRLLGDRSLVLVGMMGAGKTTVGRRLAERLGRPFIDADSAIEDAARMSVAEIFAALGEERFRAAERRVIARLLGQPGRVLALGGGAFLDAETRRNVKAAGISIWLDAEMGVLAERVRRRNTRPLLMCGNVIETLEKYAQERRPAYAEADLHVPSDKASHASVIDRICLALLNAFEKTPPP